jgi:hypothetical protein
MSFEQNIQKWLAIDNQIKNYNDKIRELREKKHELTENVIEYASENNLSNSHIQISDGKLKITKTKVPETLTFKYLEKSLSEIIKNENQIKIIMEHIKTNRESKIVTEIKRFSDN